MMTYLLIHILHTDKKIHIQFILNELAEEWYCCCIVIIVLFYSFLQRELTQGFKISLACNGLFCHKQF